MDIAYRWSYVSIGLAAPLLAWLLVAGRQSLRRTARLLAGVGVLLLLVELAAIAVAYGPWAAPQQAPQLSQQSGAFLAGFTVANVAALVSGVLATATWVVLLVEAARAGRRARLVALMLVLGGTLALGELTIIELSTFPLFHDPLQQWLLQHLVADPLLVQLAIALLTHSTTVAAAVCAFLLPPVEPRVVPVPPPTPPPAPASAYASPGGASGAAPGPMPDDNDGSQGP